MTSELTIDMDIHVYGTYCQGYQMFTKHWNFEIMRET